MSPSFPPEIFDVIIDHLHDEPTALQACCLVSKSWIPRTRTHLFAHVVFYGPKSPVERWKKTFPDPSNSPACYTRTLSIRGLPVVTAADMGAGGWIRTFHSVEHLELECHGHGEVDNRARLIPFYGLSSTVKSLHLSFTPFGVFDLVCSFPLLEDLALLSLLPEMDADTWNVHLTSPKLTGTLELRLFGQIQFVTRRLLNLPNGLHFTKIVLECFQREEIELATGLVFGCSRTLESLDVKFAKSAFSPVMNGQYLAANPLLPLVAAGAYPMPLLGLSSATKLKDVTFRLVKVAPQWITMALQTVNLKNLQQVVIQSYVTTDPTEETVRREWEDLDHLLVHFRTTHSVRLQVVHEAVEGNELGAHVLSLLPELAKRGLVEIVDPHQNRAVIIRA